MFTTAVFTNRGWLGLLGGQLLSQICDRMMTLGLVWVISIRMSVAWVPWFLAVGALPHLLLGWKAGGLASRWGALKTVIWTDLARGAIFIFPALIWNRVPGHAVLAILFALTLLANVASALFNPAILSLPASLCSRATEAPLGQLTAAVDSCFSAGTVIGPVLSALLYPWIGLRGLLLVNGLSYVLAAILEAQIPLSDGSAAPSAGPQQSRSLPRSAMEVLRADSLIAFVLVAFSLMNLVLTPMIAFLPLFSKEIFRGHIGTFASLETSLGIGTIAGSMALSVLHLRSKTGVRAIGSIFVISAMYLAFALSRDPRLACGILLILGLALSVVNVTMMTFFQSRPEPQDIPVVMSLVNLISVGVVPISMLAIGALVTQVDMRSLVLSLALALLALAAGTALHPELRRV